MPQFADLFDESTAANSYQVGSRQAMKHEQP